jgi:hypothetical protein
MFDLRVLGRTPSQIRQQRGGSTCLSCLATIIVLNVACFSLIGISRLSCRRRLRYEKSHDAHETPSAAYLQSSTPPGFDWRGYYMRYSDLRASGHRSPEAILHHYIKYGRPGRRTFGKIPVMLRYTACHGLFNQMYAHINALVLAHFLGADVVLPPSLYRCDFLVVRVAK